MSEKLPSEKKAVPQKSSSKAKSKKKRGPRPALKTARASKTPVFSDSVEDRFGEKLAAQLKKHIEDGIKRRIKEAQSDPKVQRASAKYGSN